MKIADLYLENFRCFEKIMITFSEDYTVFIGNNGSGKSSILNAVKTVLAGFIEASTRNLSSLTVTSISIKEEDVRLKTITSGSILDHEASYPVSINMNVVLSPYNTVSWGGSFNSYAEPNHEQAKPIAEYVKQLQESIKAGNNIMLPVIAYYGTRRQWDKTGRTSHQNVGFMPRMNGYINSLSAEPFNIDLMRHWFSRMLLISRKKPVPEFEAVRKAITSCYMSIDRRENISDVKIDYDAEKEDIEIQIFFDDGSAEILPMHYLSDGSKNIFAVVSDIAYRMAVLNPWLLDNVITETYGVVMIDEIDMHLHPSWQRRIIDGLHNTFPKVQFILTTHSPTVLTNITRDNIRILDSGKIITPEVNTYGRDVNSILREVMQSDIRPPEIEAKLTDFSDAIDNSDVDSAEQILGDLRNILGNNDSEVVGAQITLDIEKNL